MICSGLFFVLPALAEWPPIRQQIEFHRDRQINGNATFYTEQAFIQEGRVIIGTK